MAHAFKTIPAKPSFGVLKESVYQSDYIARLKSRNTFCDTKTNGLCMSLGTSLDKDYNTFHQLKHFRAVCDLPFNKSDLVVNLYSKMNLQDVCVIGDTGTNIYNCNAGATGCNTSAGYNPTISPFYQQYTIDPCGKLFGNTQCGIKNFTNYMVFYPPTTK